MFYIGRTQLAFDCIVSALLSYIANIINWEQILSIHLICQLFTDISLRLVLFLLSANEVNEWYAYWEHCITLSGDMGIGSQTQTPKLLKMLQN